MWTGVVGGQVSHVDRCPCECSCRWTDVHVDRCYRWTGVIVSGRDRSWVMNTVDKTCHH